MARGDGKARKGFTRGTPGVKRMATGGLAGSTREGGFAGAGTGRLESPGQRSSVSPGAGNVSAGNVPGGGGGSGRDSGYSPGVQRDIAAVSGGSAAGQLARLGPNAAEAMTQAGINSGRSQMLSGVYSGQVFGSGPKSFSPSGKITDRVPETTDFTDVIRPGVAPYSTAKPLKIDTAPPAPVRPFTSGATSVEARSAAILNPAAAAARLGPDASQAMTGAGVSPDTAIRAAMSINRRGAPSATTPPARSSRPEDVFGGFSYAPQTRQPTPGPRMMSSAQDYASITPGSVSFTAQDKFTPFAQTPRGQELLNKSQSVMSWEESQKLMADLPPKTKYSWEPVKPSSGYTSYPVKVDTGLLGVKSGYVNIPNAAGTTVPGAIKVGTWNPAAPAPKQITDRLTPDISFGMQTARAEPSLAPKTITDKLPQDPTYGAKQIVSRLPASYTGPTLPPVYTPPPSPQVPLPRPRPVVQPVVAPAVKPSARKGPLKEGSVFVKDGVRYQIRGGKAYNFNIPGSSFDERDGKKQFNRMFEGKRDGGVVRKRDGKAGSGKTKGRYI